MAAQVVLALAPALLAPTLHPMRRSPLPRRAAALCQMSASSAPDSADAALDEMIRREVEAAVEGMDGIEGFSEEEQGELDKLIADKGDLVMRNVLSKLESDGDQLAATLQAQVASYTRQAQVEMLRKFDEEAASVQRGMLADREAIRSDLGRLNSLKSELDELQSGGGGGGFTRNGIVGTIAFIAGLLYLGNSVNELLRLAFGEDGSVGTLAVNSALALLGLGYYAYKKKQE